MKEQRQAGSICNQLLTLLNRFRNLHQTNQEKKNVFCLFRDPKWLTRWNKPQSRCKGRAGSMQTGTESRKDTEEVTPPFWWQLAIWFSSATAEKCTICYSFKWMSWIYGTSTGPGNKLFLWFPLLSSNCLGLLMCSVSQKSGRKLIWVPIGQPLSWGAGDWQKLNAFCKQKVILSYIFHLKLVESSTV